MPGTLGTEKRRWQQLSSKRSRTCSKYESPGAARKEPAAGPSQGPGRRQTEGFSRWRGRKSQKLSLKGRWSHSWPLSWAKGQSAQGGQKATGRCQRGVRFLPETGGGGPWEPGQQVLTSPVAQGTGAGAGDRTTWGIMEWKSKAQSLREADRL